MIKDTYAGGRNAWWWRILMVMEEIRLTDTLLTFTIGCS